MAATGKTPILLYGSTTATNAPVAGNLINSSDGCEIAINVADKNLFFKDSTNTVNTVPIRQSSASSNGWLSSTDWSTFNNKVSSQWVTSGSNIYYTTGNVGIGNSSPTEALFVSGNIAVPNNGYINLGSNQGGGAKLFYDSSGDLYVTPRTGYNTTFTAGNVIASTGNFVVGTSGKGIDFSATAGTGTSELLADYEEGTWDPVFAPTAGAFGTVTYAFKNATYTKVGNTVRVNCAMRTTAFAIGTGTGTVIISGLPYTSGSTANAGVDIGYSVNFTTNQPSSGVIAASSTSIALYYRATANGISTGLPVSDLQNGANLNYIVLTAVYNV